MPILPLLLTLLASSAFAANTPIAACRFTIDKPGRYEVTRPLDCPGADFGIRISRTQDVTLVLNDFNLTTKFENSNSVGIDILSSSNVLITGQSPQIVGFGTSIRIASSNLVQVGTQGSLGLHNGVTGLALSVGQKLKLRNLQIDGMMKFAAEIVSVQGLEIQNVYAQGSSTALVQLERVNSGSLTNVNLTTDGLAAVWISGNSSILYTGSSITSYNGPAIHVKDSASCSFKDLKIQAGKRVIEFGPVDNRGMVVEKVTVMSSFQAKSICKSGAQVSPVTISSSAPNSLESCL